MRRLLNILKQYSFIGIILLLTLILGFSIKIEDIVSIALSSDYGVFLTIVCVYTLISVIVFVIVSFVSIAISQLSLTDTMAIDLDGLFSIPYRGFRFPRIAQSKKEKTDARIITEEIVLWVVNIIEMLICWGIIGFVIFSICHNSNPILEKIEKLSTGNIALVLGITVVIYVVLAILVAILLKIKIRHWKQGEDYSYKPKKGTPGQLYYDKHPERLPLGCSACGGPYPECRSSCHLFDE